MTETTRTTADVWQFGFGCGHAVRSMTAAEAREQGYTHFRVVGYLDVDGPCPACTETRAAARTRKRRPA